MKGIIEKTTRGWIVKEIVGEGPEARLIKTYPLNQYNVEYLEPCVLGEYGEVVFDVFKEYSNNNTNETQAYAKLSIPLLSTLKTKINSMTIENSNKEIKEMENTVKNDTTTYKANECCGAEECVCKKQTAIGFGEWILFNNISYINNTSEGPVYKFMGFGLTIKELYELYSKKL